MNRLLIVLGLVLVVVTTGRYMTEAEVRAKKDHLARLTDDQAEIAVAIDQQRLNVEVLESTARLSELNAHRLDLDTVSANQLIQGDDLAAVIGLDAPRRKPALDESVDVIGNAIGMSTPAGEGRP